MFLSRLGEKFNAMLAYNGSYACCKDITWESLAPAYNNSNFLKIYVNVIKGDSSNGSKTTTALEKNEIEEIHVFDNISDGFDEIPMKYFPKKTKRASCRELKLIKVTLA